MLEHRTFRNRFFLVLRLALILAIIVNVVLTIIAISQSTGISGTDLVDEISERVSLIFWGLVTLLLSFSTDYIEKKEQMDIPDVLEVVIVLFIYAGLFLSAFFDLYYRFFWWDDLLHTLSGMIIGFIGFIVIYKLNENYSIDLSPKLVALFAFTFAVTLGVLWEILEFSSDVLFGTAHQKWNLPPTEKLMGKPYQGSGLRDTMSDLIVDSIGALITSTITYYMYKNEETFHKLRRFLYENILNSDESEENSAQSKGQETDTASSR